MTRHIRVRGIKRKEIDEDKLALAFLLLAKILHEQKQAEAGDEISAEAQARGESEAA